jgi:hypothetical protein
VPRRSGRDEYRMGPAPRLSEAGGGRSRLADELEVRRRTLQELRTAELVEELETRSRVLRELDTPQQQRPSWRLP